MVMYFLSRIDPNSMILMVMFVIIFAVLMFLLGRTMFKENQPIKTVIALAISLLAIYGINRTNLDVSNLFYSLGLSQDLLYTVVPILILLFIAIIGIKKDKETGRKKFSLSRVFMILGMLLIILSFTPITYEKGIVLAIGAILLAIGIVLWLIGKRKKKDKLGLGDKNIPRAGRSGEKIQEQQEKEVLEQARQQGIQRITEEARNFKQWAKSQPNPKFVGSWAYFINYLNRRYRMHGEREICEKFYITKNDFVSIFNRYGRP